VFQCQHGLSGCGVSATTVDMISEKGAARCASPCQHPETSSPPDGARASYVDDSTGDPLSLVRVTIRVIRIAQASTDYYGRLEMPSIVLHGVAGRWLPGIRL
jgi:hypothetical protein